LDNHEEQTFKAIVVDDDPSMCDFVALIAADQGLSVVSITDPRKFKAAYSADIDLIFLDLLMPSIDGIQLLRFLADNQSQAVIVIMSGVDQDILTAAENIATDHGLRTLGLLTKPLSPANLISMIDRFKSMVVANSHKSGFADGMARGGSDELPSLNELRDVIANRGLEVFYQPKVSLGERRASGAEALVRWNHPSKGFIPPDYFVPFAEKYDLIDDLTQVVVESVFAFSQNWLAANAPIHFSINLSQFNLADLALPQKLADLAQKYGVPSGSFTLEITETGLITHSKNDLDVLTRLRLKGFQLSIDDYGTGHSSLARLSKMPFRELKIDKIFVDRCDTDRDSQIITMNTIELAKRLGLRVVAEGIEKESQMAVLHDLGCDQGQGYLFSKPLAHDDFRHWYQSQ
jgi:EAL domain-containing protein (putative c-di-GMP-specific phosphodiesterase class I)/FixJ family two-component response regulator